MRTPKRALAALFLSALTALSCETPAPESLDPPIETDSAPTLTSPRPNAIGARQTTESIIHPGGRTLVTTVSATTHAESGISEIVAAALTTNQRLTGAASDYDHIRIELHHKLPPGIEGARRGNALLISRDLIANRAQLEWVVAHEVGHLRWNQPAPAVTEGMAELTAALATGRAQPALEDPQCEADTQGFPWCDYRTRRLAWLSLYESQPKQFPTNARKLHQMLTSGREPRQAVTRAFKGLTEQELDRLTQNMEVSQ